MVPTTTGQMGYVKWESRRLFLFGGTIGTVDLVSTRVVESVYAYKSVYELSRVSGVSVRVKIQHGGATGRDCLVLDPQRP